MIEVIELVMGALAFPAIVAAGVAVEMLLVGVARAVGIEPAQLILAEVVLIPLAVAAATNTNRGSKGESEAESPLRSLETTRKAA